MENLTREELEIELADVKLEIKNAEKPTMGATSSEDLDDAHQECLEYGWWINEKEGRIEDILQAMKNLDDGDTDNS